MTAALEAALRAAAGGVLADEAAAGLLAGSGAFLHRADFAGRFVRTAVTISDGTPVAWADWHAVAVALDRRQFPASSGEKAVLRLAASLAEGIPVSLRDTAASLDRRNLDLAVTAIRHAAGHP